MLAGRMSRVAHIVGMSGERSQVDGRAGQRYRDQQRVIGVDKRRIQRIFLAVRRTEAAGVHGEALSSTGGQLDGRLTLPFLRSLAELRRSATRYRHPAVCGRSSNSAGVLDAAWHLGCPEAIPDIAMMSSLTDDGSSSVL